MTKRRGGGTGELKITACKIGRLTNNSQINKQTDGKSDRQTDWQIDRHILRYILGTEKCRELSKVGFADFSQNMTHWGSKTPWDSIKFPAYHNILNRVDIELSLHINRAHNITEEHIIYRVLDNE